MGSLTKERLCNALKELGIKEVILGTKNDGDPLIEIAGEDFRIFMTNDDFSERGL